MNPNARSFLHIATFEPAYFSPSFCVLCYDASDKLASHAVSAYTYATKGTFIQISGDADASTAYKATEGIGDGSVVCFWGANVTSGEFINFANIKSKESNMTLLVPCEPSMWERTDIPVRNVVSDGEDNGEDILQFYESLSEHGETQWLSTQKIRRGLLYLDSDPFA